jgi:O-methyltransferase
MNRLRRLLQAATNRILPYFIPSPIREEGYALSLAFNPYDEEFRPSDSLISLALETVQCARSISLKEVSARLQSPPYYPEIWPGEHYRLLAALVQVLQPKCIVEVGTGGGLSSLSMRQFLPEGGRILTFDITDWRSYKRGVLREEDFTDGRLVQHTDDLTEPAMFKKFLPALAEADLLFIDAEKDGATEQRLIDNFGTVGFSSTPLFMFDDIRLWNMAKPWKNIRRPKLDLTSFGHWSGTGLVEWS